MRMRERSSRLGMVSGRIILPTTLCLRTDPRQWTVCVHEWNPYAQSVVVSVPRGVRIEGVAIREVYYNWGCGCVCVCCLHSLIVFGECLIAIIIRWPNLLNRQMLLVINGCLNMRPSLGISYIDIQFISNTGTWISGQQSAAARTHIHTYRILLNIFGLKFNIQPACEAFHSDWNKHSETDFADGCGCEDNWMWMMGNRSILKGL